MILSDVGMPDEDGYSFITKVRAAGSRVPAAALTAYARSNDRLRALSSGFQAHLPKPAESAELVVMGASLAGGRRKLDRRLLLIVRGPSFSRRRTSCRSRPSRPPQDRLA